MEQISTLSVTSNFTFDVLTKEDDSAVFVYFALGYRCFGYTRAYELNSPDFYSISESSKKSIHVALTAWVGQETVGFTEFVGSEGNVERVHDGIYIHHYMGLPSTVDGRTLPEFTNRAFMNNNGYQLCWTILDDSDFQFGLFTKYVKRSEAAIRSRKNRQQQELAEFMRNMDDMLANWGVSVV